MTTAVLGERLNTVTGARCGQCGRKGGMDVHAAAVRWTSCGHTRTLPPLQRLKTRPS